MVSENETFLIIPKPEVPDAKNSLIRTLISLVLYILISYFIFKSWTSVFLMATILIIHESGHFLTMKLFGYQEVNMTFVPFVGAYVSGEATKLSRRNKILVLLAGPVPGIIIGLIIILNLPLLYNAELYMAGTLFLFLNVFNLLPVSPLDGGQLLETIFINGNRVIQLAFLYLSQAIVLYIVFRYQLYSLLIIALFLFLRILLLQSTYKLHKKLDEGEIDYHISYKDLDDENYTLIRNVVVENNLKLMDKYTPGVAAEDEQNLVPYIKAVLSPYFPDKLVIGQKIFFITIWLASIIVPVYCWGLQKGFFVNWFH